MIHEHNSTTFDTQCLLQFNIWYYASTSNLIISLCSVDNTDQLIEIYLIDKYTQYATYYQIVSGLEQNQNLSVMLVGSNTLVGYRSNHHQLINALNMNGSLKYVILRYCAINNDIANILSSYFVKSHCLKHLSIDNSNTSSPALLSEIL